MKKLMKVQVRDSDAIVFEGDVDRISSFNEVGRFDVFPMHANFISIIHQELTLFNNHQKVKELKIEEAVLKVKQDSISIFLGIEALVVDEEVLGEKGTNAKPQQKNVS